MKTKTIIRNINPFNNAQEMPKALFAVKKMLAFIFIYMVSAIVGEGFVIGTLTAMGYDPLHGVMPTGYLSGLLPYYGFAIFFIVALLYCKFVEKRNLKSFGFNKKGFDYIIGAVIAVLLLAVIVGASYLTSALSFNFITTSVDPLYLTALFVAFFIQSFAEEVLCRGFLLKSLEKKAGLPLAIFVSSTAFALPHLPSMLEADFAFAVIGILNLYLVSVVFSLLYMLRANIYVVAGLHCVWNFVLNGVMGLSVSGSNSNENALMNFTVNSESILNGGVYGLEASVITTVVLGVVAFILVKMYRKRGI